MELTEKQKQGLEIAVERFKNKERYTVISGYAGTGKSTLVKFIIDALYQYEIKEEDIVFTSFTGKACTVLQKKGNKNVSTLHKLLYRSFPNPDGTYSRIPVETIKYKIVVVDEVSMVPMSMMKLLASYDAYVLCLGDPYQLPPIDKNEDNHLLDNPHIFLDEIQRQAAESEIIQLTMKIRNHEEIPYFKGKEVQIIKKEELNTGMLMWADQILVGTNSTRNSINNQMRNLLGRGDVPEDGDKIICLKNYWEINSNENTPLINGTIGYLKDCFSNQIKLPYFVTGNVTRYIPVLYSKIISETEEEYKELMMDKKLILEGEESLDWKTKFKMSKSFKYQHLVPKEFAYGYAITTHKAQGSEWDKVLVIEEKFPYNKEEHARWLYTACTRASEKLVLVRP